MVKPNDTGSVYTQTLGDLMRWIWKSDGSPLGETSFAERVVLTALTIGTRFSFLGLVGSLGKLNSIWSDLYHLGIIIVLVFFSAGHQPSPLVAFGVLAYLVYETVAWSIFDIFVTPTFTTKFPRGRSYLRGFMWSAYSYSVIAWAYGIYFWSSGHIVDSNGTPLTNAIGGIYYSFVTITTIGYGDYAPSRNSAVLQLIVISEPLVGLIVLVLYFAVLVSAASEAFRNSLRR